LETNAAGPRRIRFRFHHPLDDGTITWLTETVDGLKPVTLPEVGFGLPIPKTSDP
jgi:hypothetical protein